MFKTRDGLTHNFLQEFKNSLRPTPLSSGDKGATITSETDAASRPTTWFHARHWYSSLNSGMEVLIGLLLEAIPSCPRPVKTLHACKLTARWSPEGLAPVI